MSDKQDNQPQTFVPSVTPKMYKAVSQFRREKLEGEVQQGLFRDGSGRNTNPDLKSTPAGYVTSGGGMSKLGQDFQPSALNSFRGGVGNVLTQIPEVYSPLWLTSNLNLPRDRATMNAWCRAFYALNPIVQNAINLHSTYPISKLNIKCPNKKVERLFGDMIDETDLLNICAQAAQEYWLLGEAIVMTELDERTAKWNRIWLQNPDYVVIQRSVIQSEPVVMIKPDENLKRVCTSNLPRDVEQRKQLNDTIIQYVRRGQNIPVDNMHVSHLARRIAPYEIRGTGLPVSIFRSLMLYDQIKECYHADTEVLTDQGFKQFHEVIDFTETPNGIISKPKSGIKIACFNPDNEQLEYHQATDSVVKNYSGDLVSFHGEKVDVNVTPGHNMWVKRQVVRNYKSTYTNWHLETAETMLEASRWYKFRTHCRWQGREQSHVDVLGTQIPIADYLKFMGYLISEGTLYTNFTKDPGGNVRKNHYDAVIKMPQITASPCFDDIYTNFHTIASYFGKHVSNQIRPPDPKSNRQECWNGTISGKELVRHFKRELGLQLEQKCNAYNKCIPRWILELKPDLLKIILESLVNGDAHRSYSKYNDISKGFQYTTVSKQLANDVYELVYKCGFAPNMHVHRERRNRKEYIVLWSNTVYGQEPNILTGKRKQGNGGGAQAKRIPYQGKVWCLTVPTGLFITRSNYLTTIQGNCKYAQAGDLINPMRIIKIGGGAADYRATPVDLEAWREVWSTATNDRDFKIFTHDAVTVETIGANTGIYDTSNDFNQLFKEMYAGLMIPGIIIDGGGDVTYANGGISLDVLRQRYMQFRHMMSAWLRRKIFQPISKLNDFYDYVDGEKTLIIPEIDWNHMSLFDLESYVQHLRDLTGQDKRASVHALYRSLGLEWEEERRKIRKEDIAEAIRKKEQEALAKMSLNELRTLGEDAEIQETLEPALPGLSPYEESGNIAGGLPGAEPPGGPPLGAPPPPPAP